MSNLPDKDNSTNNWRKSEGFLLLVLFLTFMVFMIVGCSSNKPEPTVGDLLSSPTEKRSICIKPKQLPRCPGRSVMVYEMDPNRVCVWRYSCESGGIR